MTATYKITRFFQDGPRRDIQHGLSLEEAQEWCSDDSSHGDGWFDGYYREWDEGDEE